MTSILRPIKLKEVLSECGISQGRLAKEVSIARTTMVRVVNERGYIPSDKFPNFKNDVEQYLTKNPAATKFLREQKMKLVDIWKPLGRELRNTGIAGQGAKMKKTKKIKPLIPGDPGAIITREVEMIQPEAMKHFKIFRNPFIDDVQKEKDVFMSSEHRYIEAAMIDAARHSGFLAVIGEVGSGKSVMRKKVVEQLRRDGDVLVIYPQIIDKTRLSSAAICDAIIMDISDDNPKQRHEQKTRQVQNLLLSRSKNGYRSCLVIEEAHDLNTKTLKYLKRFYELEDGYKKLLGIILIGQTELKHMFDESQHVDMREVIRRVQVAEIKGLNGNIKDYLLLKFKRVGSKIEEVFTSDAFESLSKRLTSKDRNGKIVSHAYPLTVNNCTARAMNRAFEMGESLITAEIIDSLQG